MYQIVLPIIFPTFGTMLLLSCVSVFGASGPILLFTKGMYKTSTISYWMYEYVVENGQYNFASAFGLILSLASLPAMLLVNWLTKKIPEVEF
jgi:ABC-type sugar transport system permease subunit